MPLIEPIIRPPSEAESLLLQVTTGCSANTCSFCGAYKDKPFRVVGLPAIAADITAAARAYPDTRRAFLLDGDALCVHNTKLIPVLDLLISAFPKLARVASYANGSNITPRTDDELRELAAHKFTLAYMGLESGSQAVLDRCHKRSRADEMVEAVQRLQACGIKCSVIVLLGLGGEDLSKEHVRETVTALNAMQPRYLSFLCLMLIPGTLLYGEAQTGRFSMPLPEAMVAEACDILAGLELEKTIFRSNHASNYVSLEGRLSRDKDFLLEQLSQAACGARRLRPEMLRGL